MNPPKPIVIPPELADVPMEYREPVTMLSLFSRRSGRSVDLPELAHIPERHRPFVVAFCFYKLDLLPRKKDKFDEAADAAFIAVLTIAILAGSAVGYSLAGGQGGAFGAAIGSISAFLPYQRAVRRHGQRRLREFLQSEECRWFIEKLK